jgi:hypothetical protein
MVDTPGDDPFTEFWVNPEELARAEQQRRQREKTDAKIPPREFPRLAEEAFYGPVGQIVRTIEPHTESDPALLLLGCHVYFGNAVGRGPYYRVEGTKHRPIFNVVFCGDTAKGRKGTGDGRIREIFDLTDPLWCRYRIQDSNLSSGEGLVEEVRDPRTKIVKGEEVIVDAGVDDKRLLVVQSEFGGTLQVLRREGSTLSAIMRNAWDGKDVLGTMTKHSLSRATGAHISAIGHITASELRNLLDEISIANGFGNRFLFACVRRARRLPFGGELSDEATTKLAVTVHECLVNARDIGIVGWAADGRTGWVNIYDKLSEGQGGLAGALTARAEAQVVRLAMSYALWDGVALISLDHLIAAMAVWNYCEASVRYIFGESLGDPVIDAILAALRRAYPDTVTRTAISQLFSRNESAGRISRALDELVSLGLATVQYASANGAGRPTELWIYTPTIVEGAAE